MSDRPRSRGVLLLVAAGTTALAPAAASAQSASPGGFGSWIRSLEVDARVLDELDRFRDDGRALSQSYARELATTARREVVERADRTVSRIVEDGCEPFVDVSFDASPRGAGESRTGLVEAFEESLLRIELVACIESATTDPGKALRTFTDPAFRRSVEPRIARIWVEDDLSCVETDGVAGLLDPARACNRIDRYEGEALAAEHSQVVANPGDGSYQIVYFKESLKSFVRLPGGVAVHYVHFSRSADLNRLARWIGKGRVRDAEERKVIALERALGR